MSRRRTVFTIAALGTLAVTMLGGCSGLMSRDDLTRMQPTPELDTLHQRSDDIANAWTIMDDENWRMFIQDLGRAFYTDRPSRLTREPVPHP
jgi:hypothetical protein